MTIHRRFRVIFGAGACALVVLAACDSPSGAGRRACGAGELRLEPGDAVALGPNEDVCSLASAGDAEYVLAYLDTRGLDAARDGNEAYLVPSAGTDTPDETFGIQITVEGAARGAAASAVIPHPVAEVPPAMDAHAAAGPLLSTAPFALPGTWAAGDTFSVRVPCIGDCGVVTMLDQHATVLSVLDDWIAFAAVDGLPSAQLAAFHETLRQGWPTVRQHALPLLRDVLDDGRPVTTPAGRLLVLIEPELGPFSGFAHTAPSGDQVFGFVRLKLRPDLGAVNMAGLMAHELAHLYQRMYNHRTRNGGSESRLGTALWGTEGSADLVRYETIRRAGALPLAGNYDWLNPGTGAYASFFARLAQPGTGEFSRGYGGSMGFLRRLVAQRVADGESVDQAMREVVRGAIEGWYGKDLLGSTRPGLAARMAERFSGWKPEDAMLEWTLAHAADDLTPSARHQDAAFQRISAIPSGYDALAWRPDLEIEGGAGGTYTVERRWGGTGYSYLRDTGAGIRFRAAADTPGVRWMLMRIR